MYPKQRGKMTAGCFPQFSLGTKPLQFVKEFKYLGHTVTDNMSDNADIQREIRSFL